MTQARGKRQNVKKGFFMNYFDSSLSITERIFNAIGFVAIVSVGVCLALAYFDVLTK
jgi:hypothetical protein